MDILYRAEDTYGSGIRDIYEVIFYELVELGNTDILEYCLEHYLLDTIIEDSVEDLIDNYTEYDEEYINDIIYAMIHEIEKKTNTQLKYCLWLASKEAVEDLYAGENINKYYTSNIILSDLDYDGTLYAYKDEPEPVE